MTEYLIIKPKVDNNSTCIAAQHSLLESLLCLNKGLHIYQVQNRGSIGYAVTVMDANWQQFENSKSVLNII